MHVQRVEQRPSGTVAVILSTFFSFCKRRELVFSGILATWQFPGNRPQALPEVPITSLLLRLNMSDIQDISTNVVVHGAPKIEKFTPMSGQNAGKERYLSSGLSENIQSF